MEHLWIIGATQDLMSVLEKYGRDITKISLQEI